MDRIGKMTHHRFYLLKKLLLLFHGLPCILTGGYACEGAQSRAKGRGDGRIYAVRCSRMQCGAGQGGEVRAGGQMEDG